MASKLHAVLHGLEKSSKIFFFGLTLKFDRNWVVTNTELLRKARGRKLRDCHSYQIGGFGKI